MKMKEDSYPVDARGKPDLRCFVDSLDYYVRMHRQSLDGLDAATGAAHEGTTGLRRCIHALRGLIGKSAVPDGAALYRQRVHALWGLIAKGGDAIPYAMSLLQHAGPEAREDGVGILAELGRDEAVVDRVLDVLANETDATAKDAMVLALGRLKSRKAVPALAAIIRDEAADGDTRHAAVESLGSIVRKRFLRQEDPLRAAIAWLDAHPDG